MNLKTLMLEFKNIDHLTQEYSLGENDIKLKKLSASDLKKTCFKVDGRPYWGIGFSIENTELLIAEADIDGGIFYHSSEEFIQKVIQNFYEQGFLSLKVNKTGLIYIDSDPNPYSYYGLFTKHKLYLENEKLSSPNSAKRLFTLGFDFVHEFLFFQGVGPYSESHDVNVETLDKWVDKELNGKSLKEFHYRNFFEPHFHILSKDRDRADGSREDREKLWSIFIDEFSKASEDGSDTFTALNQIINELSFRQYFQVVILAQLYASLLAALYCIKYHKNDSYFASLITALHHRTINYAEQNIDEFLEFPEEIPLEDDEENIKEFVVTHQPEEELDNSLHEMQVKSIKEAKDDYRNLEDFINELYKDELELEEMAWSDEDDLLEFKASFKYDINRKETNLEREYDVVKAISALANSPGGGGKLVIGIWKDRIQTGGEPRFIGIEKDGFNNKKNGLADTDAWTLALKNRLKQYTNLDSSEDFLEFNFVVRENKTFAVIRVKNRLPLIGTLLWQHENKKLQIKGSILKDSTPVIYYRDGAQSIEADFEKSKYLENRIKDNIS